MTLTELPQTELVAFWNDTLAAKFGRSRAILMRTTLSSTSHRRYP